MTTSTLALLGGDPVTKMPELVNLIGEEELNAAKRVIESGTLSSFRGGNEVREFERAFADYVGAKFAIATTSGTTALHASVAALDLSPLDEVLVPALTFVSTASVIVQEGAKAVFVDIDETFCMDVADLERKITPRSKAIIPVHLYGQAADMKSINRLAKKYKLVVIEDACQSHGAELGGRKTGSLGDVGCFSFYQTKNMTCGEGGMITTSDERLYEQMCLRREHGSPRNSSTWYNYTQLGYNYNMTEVQGAIGKVQLAKLDKMNYARIKNAELYEKYLSDLQIELPRVKKGNLHVRHNYPILLPVKYGEKRQFVLDALRAEGIPCDVAYPTVLYKTEFFSRMEITADCPVAEDRSARLITFFTDMAINEEVIKNTRLALEKIFTYLESE